MAFTEAQRNKIAKILRITPDTLYYHLTSGAFELTAQRQADVLAEVTLWDAGAGGKFTRVHPNLKNFGAEIDPEDNKRAIREAIAGFLERPEWATTGGSAMTFELVRG